MRSLGIVDLLVLAALVTVLWWIGGLEARNFNPRQVHPAPAAERPAP
jgi:hypothetical protein